MSNYNIEDVYKKAIKWIDNNTLEGNGITISTKKKLRYPEVTGYYIPSLLRWGLEDKARTFAKYLCDIQREDGAWCESRMEVPYVFDSAQILKGLIAIRDIMPEVDENIIKGCEWILSNMHEDGRLSTPNSDIWGTDTSFCSELIHIYCLEPINQAGIIFDRPEWCDNAGKILDYYKANYKEKIENFSLLSHFYAYVMEGLYDMGDIDMCRECMERLEQYIKPNGGLNGLNDVRWVCSTGIFQVALVWYKLGELEKGNKLFDYACSIQNPSGGWYGSYPANVWDRLFARGRQKPYYFEDDEISWAVKYFLDAYYYKNKLEESRKIRE